MKLAEMCKAEDAVKEQPEQKADTAETKEETTNETETPADRPADAASADNEPANAPVADTAADVTDAPAPTITVDDITKIIVQKIKQNRSNNEKIGQILKAYGAAKVSDLSASKYEAFVTDLSAI